MIYCHNQNGKVYELPAGCVKLKLNQLTDPTAAIPTRPLRRGEENEQFKKGDVITYLFEGICDRCHVNRPNHPCPGARLGLPGKCYVCSHCLVIIIFQVHKYPIWDKYCGFPPPDHAVCVITITNLLLPVLFSAAFLGCIIDQLEAIGGSPGKYDRKFIDFVRGIGDANTNAKGNKIQKLPFDDDPTQVEPEQEEHIRRKFKADIDAGREPDLTPEEMTAIRYEKSSLPEYLKQYVFMYTYIDVQ